MTTRKIRVDEDGKAYRLRRGKWVQIPPAWVGKTVSQQTIRKRPSKQIHKHRKLQKLGDYNDRKRRKQETVETNESKKEDSK